MSNVPAYLTLVARILETAESLGLTVARDPGTASTLPENKGFVFVRVNGGNAALIVPKHADRVKWADSHLDWTGREGYLPLPRPNGAVVCRIDPERVDLEAFLQALGGASKRASKRASRDASQDASQESLDALKAKLLALGQPKAQPASQESFEEIVRPTDEDLPDGFFEQA
jgi:hypothetical protein